MIETWKQVPPPLIKAVELQGLPAAALTDRSHLDDLPALRARVNHGRWIADCDICNGAEIVIDSADSTSGLFACISCVIAGRPLIWRRVSFPSERSAIEAALAPRHQENQSWETGESVDDLLVENGVN